MASRGEFLSLLKIFSDKSYVNYVTNENSGFSISLLDYINVTEKFYIYLSELLDKGFQYVGLWLIDYLWLPCLLFGIWKNGKACACIGTQYSQEYNLNFLNALHVKYLISDNERPCINADLFATFRINSHRFYVLKREIHSVSNCWNEDFCYGIMTSGSTGIPKIIQVPWSCILPNVNELNQLLGVSGNDNVYLSSPYTFDPFFVELFMSVISGCSLTIVSPSLKICTNSLLNILFGNQMCDYQEHKAGNGDINFFCKTDKIKKSNITMLQMTPSVFRRWGANNIRDHILCDNSTLSVLLLGGEKFPEDLIKLKSKHNKTKIFNIYGITEISCWAFINDVTESNGEITLGHPLNGIYYKIDNNNEFFIGSKNRQCVVDNERNILEDEILFRRTGDLVRLKNDKIYYISRSNQLVKKFGIKVNLDRVESLFQRMHKYVQECYCVFDEDVMKIILFCKNDSLEGDYLLTPNEININSGMTSIELPDFVVQVREIPLNSNGKCDKITLLQMFKSIMREKNLNSDIESTFGSIWRSLVANKNFISGGGDSVRALQMVARLEEAQIELSKDFFPTLLNDGDYDKCLKCLSWSPRTFKIGNKKMRLTEKQQYELLFSWMFDTMKCVDASPAVYQHNGALHTVVGSHSSRLSSVKIDTGQENWTINLGDRIESGFCVNKSSTFGLIGCYDHHVYAISVADGSVVWKFKTNGMIKSTPCLSTDERISYVSSYDTYLYCLNTHDGSLVAKHKLSDSGIFSSGIVSHDLMSFYIGTLSGTCVSLNQETNEIKWKKQLDSPIFASPILIISDSIYVTFAEVTGRLTCFDADSGEKIWCFESDGYIYSTPVHIQGCVVFGCYDNHLYCLDPTVKPTLKWKTELDSPTFGKPSVYRGEILNSDDLIAVATTKGIVYLIQLESGTKMTEMKLGGEIFSSPLVKGDRLIIGCRDNNLYCLKIAILCDR